MSKEYLVKFEDEYGDSRTIYAKANNEYEAKKIAMSKAENCYHHRQAFENLGPTRISSVYEKSSNYSDDDYYDDIDPDYIWCWR